MPFPPKQSDDFLDIAGQFLGDSQQSLDGFKPDSVPSASGFGTRQVRLDNNRNAVSARKIMHWLIPEGPIIQMYMNPQQVRYNYKKDIFPQRTKGGFLIQYWGEALTQLNISGTTGTSGIEGINVLFDLYRNEQLAFDPFALFQAAKQQQDSLAGEIFGVGSALSSGGSFLDALTGASQQPGTSSAQQPPTLGSLAITVELFWSGEVYRGFFTDFSVTERADNLGLFDYDINFTVTQKRGFRQNFLGWHRSAVSGPSNSNPEFGRPYSFKGLLPGDAPTPAREPIQSTADALGSAFEGIGDTFEDFGDLF